MTTTITVRSIIASAGGAAAIETASNGSLQRGAVYKWPQIGIPDRHWPLLMRLSGASADEMLAANQLARGVTAPSTVTVSAGPPCETAS